MKFDYKHYVHSGWGNPAIFTKRHTGMDKYPMYQYPTCREEDKVILSVCCALCTVHCALCTVYCVLCTVDYAIITGVVGSTIRTLLHNR